MKPCWPNTPALVLSTFSRSSSGPTPPPLARHQRQHAILISLGLAHSLVLNCGRNPRCLTDADCGQGALHPTNKWRTGARLGNSALSIQFAKKVPWISPTYKSASVAVSGDTVSVTVTLGNATALQTTTPFNSEQCKRQMRCVEDNPFSVAAAMTNVGARADCTFKPNCDYGKGSHAAAAATTKEQCCSLCEARSGCAAGVFDGTNCWFKTAKVRGGAPCDFPLRPLDRCVRFPRCCLTDRDHSF